MDAADAECWGSPMLAERCAFVPGGRIESWRRTATEAFPGPDWVTSGDVVLYRPYSEFADLIRLFPGEFMESRLPLRGTIDAMGINVAVELRAGAELRISLVSERLGEVVAATLRTPVFRELEAWVEAADGARTPVLEITHPDQGYQVWEYDLVGANGAWHLEGLDDRATERLPFSPTLPLDEPLFVRFESRGEGSAYLRLGQLSAARDSFDTCGRSFASPLINSAACARRPKATARAAWCWPSKPTARGTGLAGVGRAPPFAPGPWAWRGCPRSSASRGSDRTRTREACGSSPRTRVTCSASRTP
ncbi:MAG: hypothetical protein IPG17_29030 [Sandaracinaceae bacterium]|nr:hypothetical protein [Sandaracinaceae bacterium]